MEIEETKEKLVCADCIGDPVLNKQIVEGANIATCAYCQVKNLFMVVVALTLSYYCGSWMGSVPVASSWGLIVRRCRHSRTCTSRVTAQGILKTQKG